MVSLGRDNSEEALFEDGIASVPERERPAEDLIAIAEAGDAVFAPAIGLRSRDLVRKEAPGIAVRAVVLAHSAPCAVRNIRPPLAPPGDLLRVAGKADTLGIADVHWMGEV